MQRRETLERAILHETVTFRPEERGGKRSGTGSRLSVRGPGRAAEEFAIPHARKGENNRNGRPYLRIPLLFQVSTARISDVSSKRTSQALDPTSKAIIEQLQRDGRRSYAEIGKAVGLSEAAVRQRVQKLTDTGVMQIVAVTDPMRLGFSRQAMLGIRVSGDTRVVADRLSAMPGISYVVLSAGSFDILVEVVCEDDDGLIELLNEKIRAVDGVAATETFVYLQLTKQKYDWGTR